MFPVNIDKAIPKIIELYNHRLHRSGHVVLNFVGCRYNMTRDPMTPTPNLKTNPKPNPTPNPTPNPIPKTLSLTLTLSLPLSLCSHPLV